MNSSTKSDLEAKSELREECEPQATHSGSSFLNAISSTQTQPNTKKIKFINSAKNQMELNLNEPFKTETEELFGKCFRYKKYTTLNPWYLPKPDQLFKEYYQLENLQEHKVKLNQVKSKLNDFVIEDWSLHTRRQDPTGEIPWRLKTETNPEFVTIAWCKMYECLGRFPELIKSSELNSLHLCEAPGAFITALNHFLHTTYDKKEVRWNWLATTLNPYYEGNYVNKMIMDDRFLLCTLENWLFCKDFTGNIIDRKNLEHMVQECEKRLGQVHLITADGSINCLDSPDCQEETVALLHYAEIITALKILAQGGSFIIKMFTMYEASSVSKLFLLNSVFEKVSVFKPGTSKRGNSEVYVVCLNYKKETKHLPEIIDKMMLKLDIQNVMLGPLFAKSVLPVDFLRQHDLCCRIFMNHQISAIEENINTYNMKPNKTFVKRQHSLRKAVTNEFYKRYKICTLPDEYKIVKGKMGEKGFKNGIHRGSHSEREMFRETSKEEQIFQLRKHLNDFEKILINYMDETETKTTFEVLKNEDDSNANLTLYKGQEVVKLNSSSFANDHLITMCFKLNEISNLSNDCLWLQNPRVEFSSGETTISIKFRDFVSTCGNFSQQQGGFFNTLISTLLKIKPEVIKFINMPFLTHYAVSILRYLSESVYSKLTFSLDTGFEIILNTLNHNFTENLEKLKNALSNSEDHILCVLNILKLHRNDFNKTLYIFNNNLLLQNYKILLGD